MSRKEDLDRKGQYHTFDLVKVKGKKRKCNLCINKILYVPGDVDPKYARFCLDCRERVVPARRDIAREIMAKGKYGHSAPYVPEGR